MKLDHKYHLLNSNKLQTASVVTLDDPHDPACHYIPQTCLKTLKENKIRSNKEGKIIVVYLSCNLLMLPKHTKDGLQQLIR